MLNQTKHAILFAITVYSFYPSLNKVSKLHQKNYLHLMLIKGNNNLKYLTNGEK